MPAAAAVVQRSRGLMLFPWHTSQTHPHALARVEQNLALHLQQQAHQLALTSQKGHHSPSQQHRTNRAGES